MVPRHIAIIPDGNRRWAKAHRLLPWQGHQAGTDRAWDVMDACIEEGIKYLTFWAASYDNLKKRSKVEVRFLFNILARELNKPALRDKLRKTETCVRIIGEWRTLIKDQKLNRVLDELKKETAHFKKHNLTILFAYDGQREMTTAINSLIKLKKVATAESIGNQLWTKDLPEVDYVIRTGGEPHWSAGFMMWLTANSQFYFTDTLWPAFTPAKLRSALAEYANRERRLGA